MKPERLPQKHDNTSSRTSSLARQRSPNMSITEPVLQTPAEPEVPEDSHSSNSNSFIFNSQEIRCSLQSSLTTDMGEIRLQTDEMEKLQNMMSILVDNQNEVIPSVHDVDVPSSSNTSKGDEENEVYESPTEVQSEHEGESDEMKFSQSLNEDVQMINKDEEVDITRRGSVHLTKDLLKKDSGDEPYKINIPLRKKVNQSTKKKLWREIERRKPFITQNVATHIQKYAKPPFITWGCKACEFPYGIQSYSKEYWHN